MPTLFYPKAPDSDFDIRHLLRMMRRPGNWWQRRENEETYAANLVKEFQQKYFQDGEHIDGVDIYDLIHINGVSVRELRRTEMPQLAFERWSQWMNLKICTAGMDPTQKLAFVPVRIQGQKMVWEEPEAITRDGELEYRKAGALRRLFRRANTATVKSIWEAANTEQAQNAAKNSVSRERLREMEQNAQVTPPHKEQMDRLKKETAANSAQRAAEQRAVYQFTKENMPDAQELRGVSVYDLIHVNGQSVQDMAQRELGNLSEEERTAWMDHTILKAAKDTEQSIGFIPISFEREHIKLGEPELVQWDPVTDRIITLKGEEVEHRLKQAVHPENLQKLHAYADERGKTTRTYIEAKTGKERTDSAFDRYIAQSIDYVNSRRDHASADGQRFDEQVKEKLIGLKLAQDQAAKQQKASEEKKMDLAFLIAAHMARKDAVREAVERGKAKELVERIMQSASFQTACKELTIETMKKFCTQEGMNRFQKDFFAELRANREKDGVQHMPQKLREEKDLGRERKEPEPNAPQIQDPLLL